MPIIADGDATVTTAAADYDTAAAVDIAVDQIFSPCCPHTP